MKLKVKSYFVFCEKTDSLNWPIQLTDQLKWAMVFSLNGPHTHMRSYTEFKQELKAKKGLKMLLCPLLKFWQCFSFGVRDSVVGKAEKRDNDEMRDERQKQGQEERSYIQDLKGSSWKQNRKFFPLMSTIYTAGVKVKLFTGLWEHTNEWNAFAIAASHHTIRISCKSQEGKFHLRI